MCFCSVATAGVFLKYYLSVCQQYHGKMNWLKFMNLGGDVEHCQGGKSWQTLDHFLGYKSNFGIKHWAVSTMLVCLFFCLCNNY